MMFKRTLITDVSFVLNDSYPKGILKFGEQHLLAFSFL